MAMLWIPGMLVLGLAAVPEAKAQMADEYVRRLSVIQQLATKRKPELGSGAEVQATVASRVGLLAQRRKFFSEGQRWFVDVTPTDLRETRKSAYPDDLREARRTPTRFAFEVLAVEPGTRARVEVREARAAGAEPVASPLVDRVVLEINADFQLIAKEVHYRDGRPARMILMNSKGNLPYGFNAYPIDLPDLSTLEGTPTEQGLEYRFSDALGRPVRAVWRDGEVWPALYESSSGTAVLVRTP